MTRPFGKLGDCLPVIRKFWLSLGPSSCATSCSATGTSIAASSVCTCACSISPCPQAGDPALTNRPHSYARRNPPSRIGEKFHVSGMSGKRSFDDWWSVVGGGDRGRLRGSGGEGAPQGKGDWKESEWQSE